MTYSIPFVPPVGNQLEAKLRARLDQKTKPVGSLGWLETLAVQIGSIQQTLEPSLDRPVVVVFAGDHGLASEGVSPFPPEVTAQMVHTFLNQGAAISVLASQHGLPVKVADAGVAADLPSLPGLLSLKVRKGTRNALIEPALTREEVVLCLQRGERLVAELRQSGSNVLIPGEMGIGNSSAAALLLSALLGLPLANCVGRGAGHDDNGFRRKLETLQSVQRRHAVANTDVLGALSCFGGCEIAMMAGAMLGAAAARMVVLVDGFIATAAAVVATKLNPAVLGYLVFSHVSAESGHAYALHALKARPLLDLGLRLGEGTGAVLAWPLLVSAVRILNDMATFESAGVSGKAGRLVPAGW